MTNAIASVIIASAQSVAKVFVIGGIGYALVLYPRKAPFLRREIVGDVARFTFHALLLPLIYSTISVSVTIESVGDYWFVLVGGFIVLAASYIVATLVKVFCIPIANPRDFYALRIAATFPNIVALPILIFPSLCEFPVVHEGYILYDKNNNHNNHNNVESNENDAAYLQHQCESQANTMIFCYFFVWSLIFWSFGFPQLMQATKMTGDNNNNKSNNSINRKRPSTNNSVQTAEISSTIKHGITEEFLSSEIINKEGNNISDNKQDESQPPSDKDLEHEGEWNNESNHGKIIVSPPLACQMNNLQKQDTSLPKENKSEEGTDEANSSPAEDSEHSVCQHFCHALKQTMTSPGFIAMALAFITACIPPLQRALFEPGAPLRFLGSALETLGMASSPISTMVVAASLVPPSQTSEPLTAASNHDDNRNDNEIQEGNNNEENTRHNNNLSLVGIDMDGGNNIIDENPAMTDPNFGPYRRQRESQEYGSDGTPSRMNSHLDEEGESHGPKERRLHKLTSFRRNMQQRGNSMRQRLSRVIPRSSAEMKRIHWWFCLSRLVITPAVVVGLIVATDECGLGWLTNVPNLAKLVIIINSALPGALIVVVILKSNEKMADTASAVANVYLPSYLLSIFFIAAWTAIGLWLTLPDEDGLTICERI